MPMKIKNFEALAVTGLRKVALEIMEAGLEAIDTSKIIQENIHKKIINQSSIQADKPNSFNKNIYQKIKVIAGFTKFFKIFIKLA